MTSFPSGLDAGRFIILKYLHYLLECPCVSWHGSHYWIHSGKLKERNSIIFVFIILYKALITIIKIYTHCLALTHEFIVKKMHPFFSGTVPYYLWIITSLASAHSRLLKFCSNQNQLLSSTVYKYLLYTSSRTLSSQQF